MPIKAAIFDVGGVLHSSENHHVEQDIITTLGISREQFEKHSKKLIQLLHLGQITEQEFWQQLIAKTNAPNPLPNESLWQREFDHRYKIFTDVLEIVEALKKKGIAVAILSNTIQAHADINQKHGIYDPFSIIILSHEVGLEKPKPEIYNLTLQKLQTAPEETIFIDDKEENIEGARRVGMRGIQFQNAKYLIQELKKLGIDL